MNGKVRVAVIGANSYIARNVIYSIKERCPEAELALYDYTESHADGLPNYRQINILDRASLGAVDFDCDVMYVFAGKTGSANGFEE